MTDASPTSAAGSAPTPFADRMDQRLQRRFVTPEGVDLRLRLAEASERFAAFAIDVIVIVSGLAAFTVLLAITGFAAQTLEVAVVIGLLGFFAVRIFYFSFFELGARAATPGKRSLGIRVAPRDGGRLRAESVFARNAMREVEVFLPLSFLAASAASDGVDAWIVLAGFVWSGLFALLPLFNRDKLRPGDIVGGTWVVKAPRRLLQPDMAEIGAAPDPAAVDVAFTTRELDTYGQHELHVLEDVLRAGHPETIETVAARIRGKIGRPEKAPADDDLAFLKSYYAALRGRLEKRLLFGRRRRDKHDIQ
ncbi:MAG: RDD family protein [Pseudomonadota bacterium]